MFTKRYLDGNIWKVVELDEKEEVIIDESVHKEISDLTEKLYRRYGQQLNRDELMMLLSKLILSKNERIERMLQNKVNIALRSTEKRTLMPDTWKPCPTCGKALKKDYHEGFEYKCKCGYKVIAKQKDQEALENI